MPDQPYPAALRHPATFGDSLLAMLAHSNQLNRRTQINKKDYSAEVQNTDCDWTARPVKGAKARCLSQHQISFVIKGAT